MENQINFDSTNPALLRQLMKEHGDSPAPFVGTNDDGERITISIGTNIILLTTYQKNGWIRKNYFDANGNPAGETFEK